MIITQGRHWFWQQSSIAYSINTDLHCVYWIVEILEDKNYMSSSWQPCTQQGMWHKISALPDRKRERDRKGGRGGELEEEEETTAAEEQAKSLLAL